MPRTPSVQDRFGKEIVGEDRRIMGLSSRLLKPFAESPARMLPRSRGLKALATATKRSVPKVEGL